MSEAEHSVYSNVAEATTLAPEVYVNLHSSGADDGSWRLTETSNFGWWAVASLAGPGALRAGDTGLDQQLKSITSFNARLIPNGATVISARLRLGRGSVYGDPFGQLGPCYVDARAGSGFGGSPSLCRDAAILR